jgi:iron(III) transport system substrate-binding protein
VTTIVPDALAHRRIARFSGRVLCLLVVVVVACDDDAALRRPAEAGDPATAPTRTVVVFTAHDRIYSEPILAEFQKRTGITVEPVYDAEAAKTTGLINRLLARRDDPECDVLWNNESTQTASLAQAGVLEPYRSTSAARIPAQYRDPQDRWTGFAARVRLFVYNTKKFPTNPPPASIDTFADSNYRGQGVIALPYYGTTFTHVGVLHQRRGAAWLKDWLTRASDNGTAFAPGNGAACELVASGERSFGLTDTDDAHRAILEGKPIAFAIPDAAEIGPIVMPNTVALVKGAPHSAEAKQLIDYLLSADVERRLAEMDGAQIPLGEDVKDVVTPWASLLKDATMKPLPTEDIARSRKELIELLRGLGLGQ